MDCIHRSTRFFIVEMFLLEPILSIERSGTV